MNVKVSVIMAVYNAAQYLDEAISSVLNQSLTEWELFCIDDGSEDDSYAILSCYAQNDSRIKLHKQANAGPMSARIVGIQQASGEYIMYLDADDMFSIDLLEKTYQRAIETGADVVAPDVYDGTKRWNEKFDIDISKTLSPIEAFAETCPWNKVNGINLWRTTLLKKYATFEFVGDNNFNADEVLQRLLLLNCNKLVYSEGYYYYRLNPNSITHKLTLRQFQRLKGNRQLIQMAKDYQVGTEIERKVEAYTFLSLIVILSLFFTKKKNLTPQEQNIAMEMLREEYTHFENLKSLPIGGILKKTLLTNGFSLFACVVYLHTLIKRIRNK